MRHLRHILLAVSGSACPPRDLATMPAAVAPDVPPSLATPAPQAGPGRFARRSPDLVGGGDTAPRRVCFEHRPAPRMLEPGSYDIAAIGRDGPGVAAEIVVLPAAQEVG